MHKMPNRRELAAMQRMVLREIAEYGYLAETARDMVDRKPSDALNTVGTLVEPVGSALAHAGANAPVVLQLVDFLFWGIGVRDDVRRLAIFGALQDLVKQADEGVCHRPESARTYLAAKSCGHVSKPLAGA